VPAEASARSGKPHPDGVRVEISHGILQLKAKLGSSRTLCKALNRLEEAGLLYRDNGGREVDKAGAFVLRAGVK
jgi:ribosomal protein S19E (S16A)